MLAITSFIGQWSPATQLPEAQLYESDELVPSDCERVSQVLEKIAREGRIVATPAGYEKVLN